MKKITLVVGLIVALCIISVPVTAVIVYAGSSNSKTTTNSFNMSVFTEPDDLLLAQISYKGGAAPDDITGVNDGWILIRKTEYGNTIGQAVYWRPATSYGYYWINGSINYGGADRHAVGGIMRFTGVDQTAPVIGSNDNYGMSNDPTTSGFNSVPADSMVVACFGYNERQDEFNLAMDMDSWIYKYKHSGTGGPSAAAARDLWTSGGDYPSMTSFNNFLASSWVSQLIVLRAAGSCEDMDGDGYALSICGGKDCNDNNPSIHPGSIEMCDVYDNDCDGSTADGAGTEWYHDATSCGVGECASTGLWECDDGVQTDTCIAASPTPELCDNLDNDCDGETNDDGTDETWYLQPTTCGGGECYNLGEFICQDGIQINTCNPGTPDPETCDLKDNDCNGFSDETFIDLGNVCSVGIGQCVAAGNLVCTADGSGTECNAIEGKPGDESCDGLDNDCDASIDNGLTVPLSDNQNGVCLESVRVCNGMAGWKEPDYNLISGYEASEVSCDGLDNDCDNSIDNGLTVPLSSNQNGVCLGSVRVCNGMAGWKEPDYNLISEFEASEVSCDGRDNDCDGLTDQDDSDITDPSNFNSPDITEGQNIVLSFAKLTGATYSFDCGEGEGYTTFGDGPTQNCPTTNDGVRNVGGKLQDSHNCLWSHPDTVDVSNLDPKGEADPKSQTVQYSDNILDVIIIATDIPADLPELEIASTAYSKIGESLVSGLPRGLSLAGPACDSVRCSWSLTGIADVPKGVYIIILSIEDDNGGSFDESVTISVEPDDAVCEFDENNVVAIEVISDGIDKSVPFNLITSVKETEPDLPTGSDVAGDINLARVTLSLIPVGPGLPVSTSCTQSVTDNEYDAVKTLTCQVSEIPVNAYAVTATIDGDYYTGYCEDMVVVYDPSLGFTTGGGWFYWPGTEDKTNIGYTIKYDKKDANIHGNFLMIRHHQEGGTETIYRVKSDTLYGLALGQDISVPMGWASFSGRSTYFAPGMEQPEVNHEFVAYVEDHDEPGTGNDEFWIQIDGGISMNSGSEDNTELLSGGNIVVPHSAALARK